MDITGTTVRIWMGNQEVGEIACRVRATESSKIADWCDADTSTQASIPRKKGKLTSEQISRLDELGFVRKLK